MYLGAVPLLASQGVHLFYIHHSSPSFGRIVYLQLLSLSNLFRHRIRAVFCKLLVMHSTRAGLARLFTPELVMPAGFSIYSILIDNYLMI
jgi:hypothetical protein